MAKKRVGGFFFFKLPGISIANLFIFGFGYSHFVLSGLFGLGRGKNFFHGLA